MKVSRGPQGGWGWRKGSGTWLAWGREGFRAPTAPTCLQGWEGGSRLCSSLRQEDERQWASVKIWGVQTGFKENLCHYENSQIAQAAPKGWPASILKGFQPPNNPVGPQSCPCLEQEVGQGPPDISSSPSYLVILWPPGSMLQAHVTRLSINAVVTFIFSSSR